MEPHEIGIISVIILLILILIYYYYYRLSPDYAAAATHNCPDGFYAGTTDYLSANGLSSAGMYIKGKKIALNLVEPTRVGVQLYTASWAASRSSASLDMFQGEGNPILGDDCKFSFEDNILTIRCEGKIRFKGIHMIDQS
jgi:hypothetical protein